MSVMRSALLTVLAASVSLTVVAMGQRAPSSRFDVLITNGRIVDGTGSPWIRGDVGIVGDRIAAVGRLTGAGAAATLDATNLVVARGFMDLLGQCELH